MGLVHRGTAAAAGLVVLAALAPAVARAEEPTRIMLVGDSITAGYTGDWTWRYRLATHLDTVGAQVDFVGPYDALSPYRGGPYEYVDPDFDRDHAAVGGRRWASTLSAPDVGPSAVAELDPDVVVVMLGVNDLVFGGASGQDVADMATTWITDLQARDPDIDVVLGELTPIAWADVAPANLALARLPDSLSTDTSTVVLARTSQDYVVDQDTVDYVHADASGELTIAAAMSDALAELSIGAPAVRPLPVVPQGPRLAPELTAGWTGDDDQPAVHLDWVPHGADGEYVWVRSADQPGWARLPELFTGDGTDLDLDPALDHDVRLQPVRGIVPADDVRSNVVRVPALRPPEPPTSTPTPTPTDNPSPTPTVPTTEPPTTPPPTTAPPTTAPSRPDRVTRVRARVRDTGRVVVRWPAAEGATSYRLEARRSGTSRWLRFDASRRQRQVLGPLLPGRYVIRVVSLNSAGRRTGAAHRFRVPS
ncbi:lysophospholipase L1-like esterase [Nocardioides sp. BE266]|uniref:SGNH/GDSL hydrolase family protein n=1 Tax=Nocardioides sp. BE266 TaxID=2817725 RepID=UPI0028657932|nr:GDSL-type esterase/lipase family protein [Nocardioides sp. BE266]MDR7254550.1 lysophospholipase L1-like esterase [Nocardioides sp. BE266]